MSIVSFVDCVNGRQHYCSFYERRGFKPLRFPHTDFVSKRVVAILSESIFVAIEPDAGA